MSYPLVELALLRLSSLTVFRFASFTPPTLATVVTDDSAIVYVWYDNEFGYSCQVIRVLERMGGYDVPSYPAK